MEQHTHKGVLEANMNFIDKIEVLIGNEYDKVGVSQVERKMVNAIM